MLISFFLKKFVCFTMVALLLILGTAEAANAAFTLEDEKKLGKEFYEKLEKNNLLLKNPRINDYVNRVGSLVLAASPKAPFDFRFYVINSTAVNAFATPGGYVYLNKGLINLAENESELAGVMAHEIAHINARHIASIIEKSTKLNIAALAALLAGAFLGGGGDASAAIATLSLATVTSMNLKYSREHEEEADRLGITYLVGAGYDGKSMLDFLKIMRRYEFYSKSVPSYFLTHPATDERIRYLDGLLQVKYRNRGEESRIGGLKRIQVYLLFGGNNSEVNLHSFRRAVDEHPSDVDALYGLALAQDKLGMTAESIRTFQRALKLAPEDGDIVRDLGIASFRAGQMDAAVRYLAKSLSLRNDDENTIIYLGRAYDTAGNFPEALRTLKLLEGRPAMTADGHYHLAIAYGKTNDQGASHYHFGRYFKEKKKNESALFHFKAALNSLALDDPRRADSVKEMEDLEKENPPKSPTRKARGDDRLRSRMTGDTVGRESDLLPLPGRKARFADDRIGVSTGGFCAPLPPRLGRPGSFFLRSGS